MSERMIRLTDEESSYLEDVLELEYQKSATHSGPEHLGINARVIMNRRRRLATGILGKLHWTLAKGEHTEKGRQ